MIFKASSILYILAVEPANQSNTTAHSEAYDKVEILHYDISVGNIMIDQHDRGLLIDWDLSKSTSEQDDGTRLPKHMVQSLAFSDSGSNL